MEARELSETNRKNTRERKQITTVKDVAREAGVGIGTVSRVLNNAVGVSQKTRLKVENAIAKLGFNPNPIAQSMRSGQTKTLACVVRDFSVPILSVFVNAMQKAVDHKGYALQVASSYHEVDREADFIRRVAQRQVDGMVIATSSENDPKLAEALVSLKIPVVLLDRDEPQNCAAVLVDHAQGVRSAILHLADLGHKRIAIVTGQSDVRPVRERIAAYREAHEIAGLPVDESLIRRGSFGGDFAYHEALKLLRIDERPTAIFAGGTAIMPGILRAIGDFRLRMPEDISLVSGADSELAQLYGSGITAVRWQHDQLGTSAAEILLDAIESGEQMAARVTASTELILRGSTGPAPV